MKQPKKPHTKYVTLLCVEFYLYLSLLLPSKYWAFLCHFFTAETLTSFVHSAQMCLPFHVTFLFTFFMIVVISTEPVYQLIRPRIKKF